MKRVHYTDVPADTVEDGAVGVKIRWLIGEDDGAPNFAMRHFEVEPGGVTPYHDHPWEHEAFILGGSGVVKGPDHETAVGPGDVVYMPPDETHCFRNTGAETLSFICMVPHRR